MTIATGELKPVSMPQLREQIEQQVREAILNGTFRPGQRLSETAIADQLQVSRAPVREVLSALEREGLVVNLPRRGTFVIDFAEKDIEEIYSLRLLLEIGAVHRAINRLSPADLDAMQQLVDELDRAVRGLDGSDDPVAVDLAFHEAVVRAADHGRLLSVWTSMRRQTQLLIGVTSKTYGEHPEQPGRHHQAILDALRAKDLEGAERELKAHLLEAQERAREALSRLGESHVEDGARQHR